MTLDDVVKTTVLLADIADFAAVNEVYAKHFTGAVLPARAAFAVRDLPKGARWRSSLWPTRAERRENAMMTVKEQIQAPR